ncbi:MAG: type IX secretion system protein PorQ [Bacteroidales bacterium]|nr:type IX secretion system protein PorQ [Bacteroidales bacterium]
MKKYWLPILLMLFSTGLLAQSNGNYVYNFLSLNYSSRIAGLGSNLISVYDEDPSIIMTNPSLIGKRHHTSLVMNFTNYFKGSNYVSALYSHSFEKIGSFAFEMRYVGYGRFVETDVTGQEIGTFRAGDLAAIVGWGRELGKGFSVGASLKMIYCGYADYNSFGIAADVAGTYYNEKKRLSVSLLFKNMGSELKPFTPGNFEKLPFDIQLAFSQRFAHIPVRYHISLHSLYKWNMAYTGTDNPLYSKDAISGEVQTPSKVATFFDNMFRHLVVGIEIIPVKYLSLYFAYNHNIHQEMKIPQKRSFAGFSYGFMINIRSIQVGFSRNHYAVGAVPNNLTFSMNIEELCKLSKENKEKKLIRNNSKNEKN